MEFEFVIPNREVFEQAQARTEELRREKSERELRRQPINFFNLSFSDRPYVGEKVSKAIFILPSVDPGKNNYIERVKRFYKSAKFPKGTGVICGYDSLLQKSLDLFRRDHGKPHTFFSGSRKFIYQGFPFILDAKFQLYLDLEGCAVKDQPGIFPQVFEASVNVHESIENVVNLMGQGDPILGYQKCFNPKSGIPFIITKEKTGPEMMNLKYTVDRMEPIALPQEYFAGLGNMHDLDKLFPEASLEEQMVIIREHDLPIPPEALELGVGTPRAMGFKQTQPVSFSPNPQPPATGNPFFSPPVIITAGAEEPRRMPAVPPSPIAPPPAVPMQAKPIISAPIQAAAPAAEPVAYYPTKPLTPEQLEAFHRQTTKGPF